MITEEILNKIYSKNLNGETITTKELSDYGLNLTDIDKLVSDGVLQKIDSDTYGLTSFEELYNFGVYLINKQDYSKAYNIFLKCHELNPNHLETCEYLFFLSIKVNCSKDAYKLLDELNNLNRGTQNNIYNLYLYLSTYTMGAVLKTHTNKLKKLELKNLTLINKENKDEYETIEYNLNDVIEAIGDIEENRNLSPVQKLIIIELIKQCKKKQEKLNTQILKLATAQQYGKIVSILEFRDRQINIDSYHKNILILSKRILEILRTGKRPRSNDPINCFDTISWRIRNGHFIRALKLKCQTLNESDSPDAEYILLTKINELISSIKKDKELNNFYSQSTGDRDIDNILANLYKQKNIKVAIELIKQFLKRLGKEEYENLIINLVKISPHEHDSSYLKVSSVLLELSKEEYEYNITVYLQYFYYSISTYQLIAARLYLNIIINYSKELTSITNSLEIELMNAQNRYNEQRNNAREFLLQKLSEMKINRDTIIILDAMPHIVRKIFYSEIKNIPELVAFGIGNEPKKWY